ncbi:MAG TPA: methylenetetrahydrofolate reductase [NAD(P)H] [Gammaproteobacteria bacterium]|nr:methylenetetrahydrofolate reductase [NAD(P)H] [Gammaproteobacteria bacterium]
MQVKSKVPVSFEVFPPKTLNGFRKLNETCAQLQELGPRFFSVTFGAIGAHQLKTLVAVRSLARNDITAVPHLSCVNMTAERLERILHRYMEFGVRHLVVIRGDLVTDKGMVVSEFKYASDLIAHIRKISGNYFHITAAAYPEFHPEAKDSEQDLMHFKRKIDAGADSAITQFFYNCDAYARFLESCHQLEIKVPIIPGIMPINDYARLLRISASCGAEIPLWLRKRLELYASDPQSIQSLGIEIVTKLCERLLSEGAAALHFYTLNQLDPVRTIHGNLGL